MAAKDTVPRAQLTVIAYRFLPSSSASVQSPLRCAAVRSAEKRHAIVVKPARCDYEIRAAVLIREHNGDGISYVRCEYITLPLYVL